MKDRPLVRIRWLDSTSPRGWLALKDWSGVGSLECESVGYLFAEDEHTITIVSHVAFPDDEGSSQGHGIMVIPRGAIIGREDLGVTDRAA